MKHRSITLMASLAVAGALCAQDWPMFGGNAAHTGATPDMAPRDLTGALMLASAPLQIKDNSGPVISGGRLYAFAGLTPRSMLYCLDAATLAVVWSNTVPVDDPGWGSWATPAAGNSCVVYAAEGFLGCWNLDGTPRWAVTNMAHQTLNSSPVIAGDTVFIGAFSYLNSMGGVAAFALATGSQLWYQATVPNSVFSSCTPALDVAAGKGYACCSNQVWRFDLTTGTNEWRASLAGGQLMNLSLASNTLLVVNYDFMYEYTNLFALDKNSGAPRWAAICGMSDVPPAIEGNTVIHACGDNAVAPALTAFELATGSNLWTANGCGNVNNMPAISSGAVYAGVGVYIGFFLARYSNVAVASVANGVVMHPPRNTLGGFAPAIADDTLYTVNGGRVYAYFVPECSLALGLPAVLLWMRRR